MIRAGKLKQRVDVQISVETRNDDGDIIRTFSTFAKRWAKIRPLKGKELQTAQQYNASSTHVVQMRFIDNLTPKMRLVHKSRNLNVISVINVEELNKEMEVLCGEDK